MLRFSRNFPHANFKKVYSIVVKRDRRNYKAFFCLKMTKMPQKETTNSRFPPSYAYVLSFSPAILRLLIVFLSRKLSNLTDIKWQMKIHVNCV